METEHNRIQALRDNAVMLYSPEDIHAALDRMAAEIEAAVAGSVPIVLVVLTGGIIPAGHILTRLAFPLEIDYLHATRYRGNTTGDAKVDWECKSRIPLEGRTVLVIDDILDEGNTLQSVTDYCRRSGASRVCTAVLIEKHHDRRLNGVQADVVGLGVKDRYVFGFGMDYRGYLRNLNGIFALEPGEE